ncbi:MAG: hypothetical protein AAGC68_15225 [Verrucomicrobiota bacterium]
MVIAPKSDATDVIEHRFNALQVGGRWKIYWYMPVVSEDCSNARAAANYGCKLRKDPTYQG